MQKEPKTSIEMTENELEPTPNTTLKRTKQRTITQYDKRILELDYLFQRLYEDSVSGKITDERFLKMSAAMNLNRLN